MGLGNWVIARTLLSHWPRHKLQCLLCLGGITLGVAVVTARWDPGELLRACKVSGNRSPLRHRQSHAPDRAARRLVRRRRARDSLRAGQPHRARPRHAGDRNLRHDSARAIRRTARQSRRCPRTGRGGRARPGTGPHPRHRTLDRHCLSFLRNESRRAHGPQRRPLRAVDAARRWLCPLCDAGAALGSPTRRDVHTPRIPPSATRSNS